MTRKSQSDAWERWIVSCCGLNKRLERSFTVGLLGILSELTGVPVPRRRVPYALGLAVACGSEFWADHVIGRTPRATVTGVRLTRRTMHFDPTRSLAVLGLAPTPAPRVAGRCGRLAPPDRAGRRIGGRDRADHAPDRTRSG